MQDFDKLWNYSDPAGTEVKFREILNASPLAANAPYKLELLTQIGRTHSLRHNFDEAHEILKSVEAQLAPDVAVEHVRYNLERGRTYNWEGNKDLARRHFLLARKQAEQLKEDGYVIDAIHMLAILANPVESIALNEQAIIFAENSFNDTARRWLGSLYNNLAWGYFDNGEYEKALSVFLRALKWREEQKSPAEIFIAKWCVARALRALNRIDDAITVQLALFEESTTTGMQDGYVHEELGELFLLKNDKLKSAFHFQKAYELLSTDKNLLRNEPKRLERIKQLAGE